MFGLLLFRYQAICVNTQKPKFPLKRFTSR